MKMKTNENGTDRDMTETELAEYTAWKKEVAASKKAKADAETAKAIARQTVLDKLGLTADEIAALLS